MGCKASVEGRRAAGKTNYDLMRATFPAGTVSGGGFAPCRSSPNSKARRAGRMPVAWGSFSFNGNLDTYIRTI